MSILVLCDHDNGQFGAATLNAVSAAQQIGGDIHLLVAGDTSGAIATQAAAVVGVDKVFEFYQSVDRLGFDTAFEATFGKPHRDYIDEFETYIQSNRINSIVRELF